MYVVISAETATRKSSVYREIISSIDEFEEEENSKYNIMDIGDDPSELTLYTQDVTPEKLGGAAPRSGWGYFTEMVTHLFF